MVQNALRGIYTGHVVDDHRHCRALEPGALVINQAGVKVHLQVHMVLG